MKPEGGFNGGTAFISNPAFVTYFRFYFPYEGRTQDGWRKILRQDSLKVQSLKLYIEGDGGGKWREAIECFINSALSLFQ